MTIENTTMSKQKTITLIRNAKSGHKRWVENAISLVKGMPLDKNQIPVNATDCVFGQWYYGEGQGFKSIAAFVEIEKYHDALHKTYRDIFVLLFKEQSKPNVLNRLFELLGHVSEEKHTTAREKLETLEYQSRVIMKKLDELEEIISAMSVEQIDSLLYKNE